MSKRSRDGDVILAIRPKKRPGDFDGPDSYKRARGLESSSSILSHKRTACFDVEVERLHKRMKATTPTAVEAMAFLLPHLLALKRVYCQSQQKVEALSVDNQVLSSNNMTLSRAYQTLLTKSTEEKRQLQRQLNNARYQLMLALPRN
tara:strand:+ start:1610 stop:2050 length:441 start_codon:yes stop_codon:yes gene_type:complete